MRVPSGAARSEDGERLWIFAAEGILHNLREVAGNDPMRFPWAVSIKLRPATDATGHNDRYVYPAEYRELADVFGLSGRPSLGLHGGMSFSLPDGGLLVEHETGPEILTMVKDFGSAAEPYLATIECVTLVAKMAHWLAKKVGSNSKSKSPDRYYHDVAYVRVERRTIAADGALREEIVTAVRTDQPASASSLERLVAAAFEEPNVDQ